MGPYTYLLKTPINVGLGQGQWVPADPNFDPYDDGDNDDDDDFDLKFGDADGAGGGGSGGASGGDPEKRFGLTKAKITKQFNKILRGGGFKSARRSQYTEHPLRQPGRKGVVFPAKPGWNMDYVVRFEDGTDEPMSATELHANDKATPQGIYIPKDGICYVGHGNAEERI